MNDIDPPKRKPMLIFLGVIVMLFATLLILFLSIWFLTPFVDMVLEGERGSSKLTFGLGAILSFFLWKKFLQWCGFSMGREGGFK